MKSILLNSTYLRITVILFCFFLNTDAFAQTPLKRDPEKAKKELENYNRQNQKSVKNNVFQIPENRIEYTNNSLIITFSEKSTVDKTNVFEFIAKELKLPANLTFKFLNQNVQNDGEVYMTYQQYYLGVKISGAQVILHEKNGKLLSANGRCYKDLNLNTIPTVPIEKAIETSIKSVNAEKYRWQNTDAEKQLKEKTNNPAATYYPIANLVIAPLRGQGLQKIFKLQYIVPIIADVPFKQLDIYIDAQTGEVLDTKNKIKYADAPNGQGLTLYSGIRKFITDRVSLFYYRLQESARPIRTRNMMNGSDYTKATQFTNRFNTNWGTQASLLKNITITTVNNNWMDLFGEEGNAPDIFIEIRDITNTLIFTTQAQTVQNATFPLLINLNDIRLLSGGQYTLRVYDKDVLFNDLLGSFSFTNIYSTQQFNAQGTRVRIAGVQSKSGAIDAHWGLERAYDFYKSLGRKSYNGLNSHIEGYLHLKDGTLGADLNNAFWNPADSNLNFMDGDGVNEGSQTALDVIGHEYTHGIIQFNGRGLDGDDETSALNESFGDIFGTALEFKTPNYQANWKFSERTFLPTNPSPYKYTRSLENPREKGDPDTYGGTNWATASFHSRAGVQNKWFYFLTNGGNSINELGHDYQIPAIGLDKAISITYENMLNKLPSDARYDDAYKNSLLAARDKGFPNPSTEFRAVREAWFAVGVAPRPVINSFTPTSGPVGTTVTITGQDFSGISLVGFNDTFIEFPNFTVSDDLTQITCVVPQDATTGYISIVAGYDTVRSSEIYTVGCAAPLSVSVISTDATSFLTNVADGVRPFTYSLDNINFQSDSTFTHLISGTSYTVYVIDANGCTGESTFFLSNPIECNIQSGSGGQGTSFITQNLGTTGGSVTVSYEMYTIPDQMDVYYNNELVATTGSLVSGSGTLTFNYTPLPGGPYHCIIRLYAPNSGTVWDFIAYCPVAPKIARSTIDVSQKIRAATDKIEVSKFDAIIYPNPTSNDAILKLFGIIGKTTISISDVSGKILWTSSSEIDKDISLPMNKMVSGIYLVTVANNKNEKRVIKLVKN